MKKQATVWLVLLFAIAAIGVVYALSTHAPQSAPIQATTPSGSSQEQIAQAETPKAAAEAPDSTELALSPDLSKTNGFRFLDLIPVGKKAPAFSTVTAAGKPLNSASFLGKKNLVLVFYQGSFCPVCGTQLTDLQQHLSDFRKQDAEIIAISADDRMHAMQTVGEHGLTYIVVPDHNKQLIKQFGVANVSKKGIAWPSLYVLDKKGVVRLSYASQSGHRMHSNEILPVLSKISGKPSPKLSYGE